MAFIQENYPCIENIEVVDSLEKAVRGAGIVSSATSGKVNPYIEEAWLKPGTYFSLPAGIGMETDFILLRARKVIDNWEKYGAWGNEVPTPTSGFLVV